VARKWWTLLAVCVGSFMLLLDVTIVNVALPAIDRDLGASLVELQWAVDAYVLALAALTLAAGSLADRLGRRLVFTAGLVVFSAASLLAGLAPGVGLLDAARGLQGIGGAAMFGTVLALIAQEFPAAERRTALGIWGATVGAAVAVGPLVGGGLTDSLGWEWIFFVNVPIGGLCAAIALARVRETRDPQPGPLDRRGVAAFSGALFLLVFGLLRANEDGWTSGTVGGSLAGGAALLAAFAALELRAESPVLDVRLFRVPAFAGASLAAFAVASSLFALLFFLSLYLQDVLGHSPLDTGLIALPLTLAAFFFAPVAGRLGERVPLRVLLAGGLTLVGAGLLLLHGLAESSEWTTLVAGFAVAGAGAGLVNPTLAEAALGVVPARRAGMAAGINNTFRQLGVAVGVAGLGAVFQGRLASPAPGETPAAAFAAALNEILLVGAAVAFAGAALALALVRPADFRRAEDAELAEELLAA
jgi:EmrB/QacA subfamily drug resistance transporter